MNDLMDKFLILLLIMILPVSIFFSAKAYNKELSVDTKKIEEERLKKVDQVIQDLESQLDTKVAAGQKTSVDPISISDVVFNKESGDLHVKGSAPGKNLNIMVSAIVTPNENQRQLSTLSKTSTKSANLGQEVLGDKVEVVAVKTDSDGQFTFIKKVDAKIYDLVELRFDQGDSSVTIQYNLVENKRTL